MTVDADIVTEEASATRKPLNLADRPDPEIVIDTAERRKPSNEEDAVAAAQRAAEEANARTAAAQAERDAALAERDAAHARAGGAVVNERLQSVTAQIDNAKAAIDSARGRKRAAREAGNYEEEDAADEARIEASSRLAVLERDKQAIEADIERRKQAGGAREPGEGGTRQPQITALEQQWLRDHPLFESDAKYHADVVGAATAAQNLGYMRGSPAFIDFVNDRMGKLYGEGHGNAATHGKKAPARNNGRDRQFDLERRPLSQAMPRSAETTDDFSAGGGVRYVDTDLGRVEMTTGPQGKPMIRFPADGRLMNMWKEAAGWSGTHRDGTPKMTLADYALEQIKIAEEERQGLNTGLTYDDERQVMR